MVKNVIHATYTETYDLNTIRNELSLLAVHTPQARSLKRMFKGFFEQYSKFKILGCNFRMVCATRQELTPDLVSVGGALDPRDVLNPILFKACTGEGMNALLDQIYNSAEEYLPGGQSSGSLAQHLDNSSGAIASYYSLLADDSFRREHPQKGITVMGLKPYVHKVVTTQPFKWSVAPRLGVNLPDIPKVQEASTPNSSAGGVIGFGGQSGSDDVNSDPVNPSVFVSNGLTEMPWLDTAYSSVHQYVDGSGTSQGGVKAYATIANIPRVYMGCLVLPPSLGTTSNLFFRMQIVWHIAFKDFRPAQDLLPVVSPGPIDTDDNSTETDLATNTDTYFNLYHTGSKLSQDFGSFDTTGIESVEKVNEKVN